MMAESQTRQAEQLIAQAAGRAGAGRDEAGLHHHAEAATAAGAGGPASEDGQPVRRATAQAFLDAADDLLASQQQLMPHPLPEELKTLTKAYIARRVALMDEARPRSLRTTLNAMRSKSSKDALVHVVQHDGTTMEL